MSDVSFTVLDDNPCALVAAYDDPCGSVTSGFPAGTSSITVSDTGSTVSVPEGTYLARILSVGSSAKTIIYRPAWKSFNQCWNFSGCATSALNTVGGSRLSNGLKITYATEHSYTIVTETESTASGSLYYTWNNASIPAGHKILLRGVDGVEKNVFNFRLGSASSISVQEYATNGIYTFDVDITRAQIRAYYAYVHNREITPQIHDLTAMFGEGNEPTLEEFEKMFPDVYDYDTGTDSAVTVTKGNYFSVYRFAGGNINFLNSSSEAVDVAYKIEFLGRY